MPRPTLTDAIREAYAVASSSAIIYDTLEIHHASFAAPIRVVAGWDAIEATLEATAPRNPGASVAFVPLGFEIDLAAIRESELPELIVRIYDASKMVVTPIEDASASPTPIEVIYRRFVSTDMSEPASTVGAARHMTSIRVDEQVVEGRAVYLDILNRAFPRGRYSLDEFPGLA